MARKARLAEEQSNYKVGWDKLCGFISKSYDLTITSDKDNPFYFGKKNNGE